MDSDGEELFLSPPEASPIQQRRLKRLKKSRVSNEGEPDQPVLENPTLQNQSFYFDSDFNKANKTLESRVSNEEERDKPDPDNPGCQNPSVSFDSDFTKAKKTLDLENSSDLVDGDRLGFQETVDLCKLWDSGPSDASEDPFGALKNPDIEELVHLERSDSAIEGFDVLNDDVSGSEKDLKLGQSGEKFGKGLKVGKSGKKRGSTEETEEKKKKKKKAKNADKNANSEVSARAQKRIEKERKAYLEKMHAESQRLLRETRDASFKPVPMVQKPVSSVLEKIRSRKLEIQKKIGIRDGVNMESSDRPAFMDASSSEPTDNIGFELAAGNRSGRVEIGEEDKAVHIENAVSSEFDAPAIEGSVVPEIPADHCENVLSDMAPDTETKGVFRPPLNDTEELYGDSQLGTEEDQDEQPYESPQDPRNEDILTPSKLILDLKLDSAPMDDDLSDEEYDDKENIDPHPNKSDNMGLYPKGDPVKAFVDDEAEEEDDSDNDRMRFEDNEEEEEDENEELHDLIATGEGEMPIDRKKRDQLHQKWLEEQDAAATDNVLQRLKCGWKSEETGLLLDEDEEDEEELGEDPVDDMRDIASARVVQVNTKKAKQMIATMYTDREDGFISSDDEEMDQKLERERFLRQTEEKNASFLSPAEDESSREVFCRIKKLNIAPDNKKRAKPAPSFFDPLVSGINNNSAFKSSFLGRTSSNTMQQNKKQGSGVHFRSFVFGRDDSNSRSALSASDISSDMDKENQPTMNTSTKTSFSQIKAKYIHHDTKIGSDSNSNSSLFEILKSSSLHGLLGANQNRQTQVVDHFAAFKSAKKVIRGGNKTVK